MPDDPKLCECGCGEPVNATREPRRFRPGHNWRVVGADVRFWKKVARGAPDACWPWTGSIGSHGYGVFRYPAKDGVGGRRVGAHRFAYELLVGAVPDGLVLDHLCRNRACVNPGHLEAVTHQVNILRGVGASAAHAVKTHCIHGHEFTPENTYHHDGKRDCRTCHRTSEARRRSR